MVSNRPTQSATSDPPKPARSAVASILKLGLLTAATGLVLLVAALAVVVPLASGSQTYTILTQSMEPTYPPGTLIVVRPTAMDDLRVGDVITYQIRPGDPTVVTHRIQARQVSSAGTYAFVTMGDNNAVPDQAVVTEAQVRGSVWYALPWIGNFAAQRASPVGTLLPVVGAALLAWSLYLLTSWAAARRTKHLPAPEHQNS